MRHCLRLLALLAIGGFSLMSVPQPAYGQFATNTPTPEPASIDGETNTTAETPATQPGVFSFATNTPMGPTSTPTSTATPTDTPTNTPTATFTPTNTPTPTPTPVGPFSYPEGVNPLTGLPYPDEESMARRNLIVKISNYPPVVRPQHGLNSADVVFEYEVEGGVTRFAAIYRSQMPEMIGSIRSARLLDIELVTMYQALLAYSGTSEPIQQILLNADFKFQLISPSIGDNCENAGFCRVPRGEDVAFEHTLFGDPSLMWNVATRRGVNTGYRARGFAFSEFADEGGRPANDVYINWYGQINARWQYEAGTGRYVRYTDGLPHIDALDGEQLWTDNLILIEVPHERRPDLFPEGVNYESTEIQLWEQGRAIVVRDGQSYQGFWRRQNREPGSALQLIYGNNTPIMMKPGRTYVQVVRGFGDFIISEERADMVATAAVLELSPSPTPLDIYTGD